MKYVKKQTLLTYVNRCTHASVLHLFQRRKKYN
eukprot:UN13478